MLKKYKTIWLTILAVGIVLLAGFMKSGRENGSMSDLFLSFTFETTIVFILLFFAAMEDRRLNHKVFNGLLLVSFFVAIFMFFVGYTQGLFIFVSANLAIYIFYLFFRNKLLKIELRKKNEKIKTHNLVLQNYRERNPGRV